MTKKIVIIGAAGTVGSGIFNAFEYQDWEIFPVDPKINRKIEEFNKEELTDLLNVADAVIFAADSGNREDYEINLNLGKENYFRFTQFCQKVAKINPNLTIWYIGGSWTKRQIGKDGIVSDDSPNKVLAECNNYEKAKILAEDNARKLASIINIRFIDWISVVPNLFSKFTIPQMVGQGIKEQKISFSPGNFGRPLLDHKQAGEALIKLMESDDQRVKFAQYLMPGCFIKFSEMAQIVKAELENYNGQKIIFQEIPKTPEYLKSQCQSLTLAKLGFVPDKDRILSAIQENVQEILSLLEEYKETTTLE